MGYQLAPKTASTGQIDALPAVTHQVIQTQTKTDTVVKRVVVQAKTVEAQGEQLAAVLEVTQNVAPETLTADSLATLLDTLSKTASIYRFEVLRNQALIDTLLLTHQAERVALTLQEDALRSALREAEDRARCAIGGMPCPTRWQAFALGVGVAATILVLR